MMTGALDPDTPIDFSSYPVFRPFSFRAMTVPIQVGNHHYAAHLARSETDVTAGVLNAGAARTGIWRETPWYMRAMAAVMGPLFFDSVEASARNAVELATMQPFPNGSWWPKVGKPGRHTKLALDPEVTARLMKVAAELTGA